MRIILPVVHPASIMRGRFALEPAQVSYLKRLAADPHAEPIDVSQPPPLCNPTPSLEDLREFVANLQLYPAISFDVENAGPHLVCCGVLALTEEFEPGPGVCFRFRRKGGEPWWPWEQHLEVVTLLDSILSDPRYTKVGHFIVQHDIPLLEFLGFVVNGQVLDTSVLLHGVHSEFPKGLAWAATLFCGAPAWKHIKDDKEDDATEEDE